MDSISTYIGYSRGLIKRSKYIGFNNLIMEFFRYYKKYKSLPKRLGFENDKNYKLFVIYTYIKICYFLWDEEDQYILDFVPRKIQKFLLPKINPLNLKNIVVDKVLFYKLAQENKLPIPKTFFYTKNNKAYLLDGEEVSAQELVKFNGLEMFSKIISGSAAVGAKKEIFSSDRIDFNENRIYQFALNTHKDVINLSPTKALNCVKASTYLENNGNVYLQLSFIKLGGVNSIVDNIGGKAGGGIAIPIDHKTGRLLKIGYMEVGNVLRVEKIPINDKVFEGFEIPYYHDAIKLALKAHKEVFNKLKHIGWDIGITDDGPVLIEGNSGADMFAAQMICRPFNYYNDKLIQENLINER